MGKPERDVAVIDERGKAHLTFGPDSWAWIEGGRLCWTATTFGNLKMPGQVWRRDFELPHGVNGRDVVELVPGRATLTLVTKGEAYRLDADAGRWSPAVALFENVR